MDDHVAAAARAAQIAVAADVPWRIKREWLSTVIWFAALPDPATKMRQRYATRGFIESGSGEHEHVVPRRWLRDAVMQAPQHAEEILALAVACNVTEAEHRQLSKHQNRFGWDRYIEARLDVIDTTEGTSTDLEVMARSQKEAIQRLGLGDVHR